MRLYDDELVCPKCGATFDGNRKRAQKPSEMSDDEPEDAALTRQALAAHDDTDET